MPTAIIWEIDQGATFRVSVTYTDEAGDPVDLTGYTAKLQVRPSPSAPDPAIATLTNGAGIVLGPDGSIVVSFSDELTATWSFTEAVWDLLLTTPAGDRYRILRGVIRLSPAVTR